LSTGDAGESDHVLLAPGASVETVRPLDGARAWLAVAGGLDVPIVLGSRSTCVAGAFGGLGGRPLATGDLLPVDDAPSTPGRASPATDAAARPPERDGAIVSLGLLRGPQASAWDEDPLSLLESTLWTIGPDSDRTGIRLRAIDPSIAARLGRPAGIPPQGTVLGAIQVPPDGSAIVLGPDRPVTGGYPMPAVLARADMGLLARLRPGRRIRLRAASPGRAIDLNADVGEGFPDDDLLPLLTSASIACGAHAGDEATMLRTARIARSLGLAIGAHPGFADREGFGRRVSTRDPGAIEGLVASQVGILVAACAGIGTAVDYVKPHGALYNLASVDPAVALAIAHAFSRFVPGLPIVLAAGTAGLAAVEAAGFSPVSEAFVDRAYRRDGTLVPRSEPGARIDDPAEAARRAVSLARDGWVESIDGERLELFPRTLCLHGDTPGAVEIARAVRTALRNSGSRLARFCPRSDARVPSSPS
ncbi:MAG: 5-oxoprolinase subunit PxpA, partial [Alphaproteobacteria bacterium]